MKKLFYLVLVTIGLGANEEIQRLDAVVQEIETLRNNYDRSQQELKICKIKINEYKNLKNKINNLKKTIDLQDKKIKANNIYEKPKKYISRPSEKRR